VCINNPLSRAVHKFSCVQALVSVGPQGAQAPPRFKYNTLHVIMILSNSQSRRMRPAESINLEALSGSVCVVKVDEVYCPETLRFSTRAIEVKNKINGIIINGKRTRSYLT
jgi:hypothetical protein